MKCICNKCTESASDKRQNFRLYNLYRSSSRLFPKGNHSFHRRDTLIGCISLYCYSVRLTTRTELVRDYRRFSLEDENCFKKVQIFQQ